MRGRSPYFPKEEDVRISCSSEIWLDYILGRIFLVSRQGAFFGTEEFCCLGQHFREEQVRGSRLLQKKRQVNVLLSHSDACFLGKPSFTSILDTTRLQAWPWARPANNILPCSPDANVCCFQYWQFLIVAHTRCCWITPWLHQRMWDCRTSRWWSCFSKPIKKIKIVKNFCCFKLKKFKE